MIATVLKVVALLGLAHASAAELMRPAQPYKGQQVVQVLGGDGDTAKVESNVDEVFVRNYIEGGLTARASEEKVAKLKALGFEVNVVVDDLGDHISKILAADEHGVQYRGADAADPDAYFRRFHSYMDIFAFLDELVATKVADGVDQTWLKKKRFGSTMEQRPMWVIEIGNPDAPEAIYMEGGLHAREWVGIKSLQYITRHWVNRFASGEDKEFFQQFRLLLVPLVNVDGYRHSYLHERLFRKNRRVTHNATCYGVDLNRNYNGFDYWEFKSDVCANNYAGAYAYSEPETQNIVGYLKDIKKTARVIAALDIHSYDQSILYPYGYDFDLPPAPNHDVLHECALKMAAAMLNATGRKYAVKTSAQLYPASGAIDDYLYDQVTTGPWAENSGLVYLVEMRPSADDPIGFVLPADQILDGAKEMLAGFNEVVKFVYAAVQ